MLNFGRSTNWAEPVYDDAGNTTTMPQPVVPTRTYTLTYDAWNRLVKIYDDFKDQNVQENEYDGLGRRIVRAEYSSSGNRTCGSP